MHIYKDITLLLMRVLVISAAFLFMIYGATIFFDGLRTPIEKETHTYTYSISGPIDGDTAAGFKDFIVSKKAGDRVVIHIESHGGVVNSMYKIMFYLTKTKANVVCYVDSHASSAAANILMSCPKISITPRALITFHVFQICTQSSMLQGCTKSRAVSPVFRKDSYHRSMRGFRKIKHIFSKAEWVNLSSGADVSIEGEVLMKRLRGVK